MLSENENQIMCFNGKINELNNVISNKKEEMEIIKNDLMKQITDSKIDIDVMTKRNKFLENELKEKNISINSSKEEIEILKSIIKEKDKTINSLRG